MAILRVGPNLTGLSTDTKPTTLIPINTQFTETDTRRVFHWTGSSWILLKSGGFTPKKNIVYKIGSTYYHERYDGTVINSGTTFETILQGALDASGDVHLVGGATYTCSASLPNPGFTFGNATKLEIDQNVIIEVPSGYTGVLFKIGDPTAQRRRIVIDGGTLKEAGTAQKLWTGIQFKAVDENTFIIDVTIRNIRFEKAGKCIELNTSGEGWINSNYFYNLSFFQPTIGVDFLDTTGPPGTDGANRNTFLNCFLQDDTTLHNCTYGFKDVRRKGNHFINCLVWDMASSATQKSMTIHADSDGTVIIGGILARADADFFVDNSWPRSTMIFADEWKVVNYGGLSLPHSSMVKNGRKTGGYDATTGGASTAAAYGLLQGGLSGYAGMGSHSQVTTFANGSTARNIPTLTTTGSGAGYRYANLFTCRAWNPTFRAKVRFGTNTLQRIFFGLAGVVSADLAGDDMLNAMAGIGIGMRSADTNFQVIHNNLTGVTSYTNTAIPVNTTAIRTFDIRCTEGATNPWKWSIDGSAWADLASAEIPAQTTPLGLHFMIITNESGVAKNMDVYEVRVETN